MAPEHSVREITWIVICDLVFTQLHEHLRQELSSGRGAKETKVMEKNL